MLHSWGRWIGIGVAVILLLSLGIGTGASLYARELPQNVPDQETLIYGQSRLSPGSAAGLRIVVREPTHGTPIQGASVAVSLAPEAGGKAVALYSGTTDAAGTAAVAFTVPEDAASQSQLIVETRSPAGEERTVQTITVERNYKVLLTTDKPIYQPGQVIRMRVLALGRMDLRPAKEQPVTLTVMDARGNKVFRQTVTTSARGVAAADFALASEVNAGDYKITAEIAGTPSEITVLVQPYVLPRFKVTAAPESPFYLPGETVRGTLDAQYFFGKPVDQGKVVLTGYTFDVQLNQVLQVEGQTDDKGQYAFEFQLPDYLVGGGLEQGSATFILEAAVTDGAEHTERAQVAIPVARERIQVEMVPESGELVSGVENQVYVLTARPDGAPVACTLTIQAEGRAYTLESDAHGLAVWKFTPSSPWQSVGVEARDTQGHTAVRTIDFQAQTYNSLLLRPDRAIYEVGETLQLEVLGGSGVGSYYLDIIREGQTVSTRVLEPVDGRGEAEIDLTSELYGTLELHAYAITPWGEIQRDTRLVVVDAPHDLGVAVQAGREVYAPGETAGLDLAVTGADGAGVPATLGLAAVDEAVYALQEQDPGFLKVYFLLEQQLLEPKYDLHGLSLSETVIQPESEAALREVQQTAATAALAGAALDSAASLVVNTHAEALSRVQERQTAYYRLTEQILRLWLIALPLAMLGLTVYRLIRNRAVKHGLKAGLLIWVVLVGLGFLVVNLGFAFISSDEAILVITLGVGGLIGLGLLIGALLRKDFVQGGVWGGWLLYMIILAGGIALLSSNNSRFDDEALLAALGVSLLLPVIFALNGGFEQIQKRPVAALGSWVIGLELMAFQILVLTMIASPASMMMAPIAQDGRLALGGAVPMDEMIPMPAAIAFEAETAGALPPSAPTATGEAWGNGAKEGPGLARPAAAPRLRQNFGETMAWLPELTTDAGGKLHVDLPLFDNITTWRLTAMAHSDDGRLGMTTVPLRVFQDFFVDFDLPYALTQHDEVAMPVAVYNYLDQPQTVRLELERAAWFELQDAAEQTVELGPNEVGVVRFRIRVTAARGRYRPVVRAYGDRLSDATTATHDVLIVPDGKSFAETWSGQLEGTVERTLVLPEPVVPGTAQVEVKIYPGVMSQVVEGMDSILQMPSGCFEQTSSSTYPDVLVLDYMKQTGQSTPEIRMKAEQYINVGYQRLTTFEVAGGGFSLFGDAPADRMLTAYGLMEFTDMAEVYPVDPDFVARAAHWLMAQQEGDGSWTNDQGLVHESSLSNLGEDWTPVTAYIVWALIHAGYKEDPATQRGLAYVREHIGEVTDPYALALVANALVANDPQDGLTRETLDRLAGLAVVEGNNAWWKSGLATMMGSEGETASLETTALAAYALIRSEAHPELVNPALNYLVEQKDERGTWYSTQATILALKALMASVTAGSEQTDATVTVSLNGGQRDPIAINAQNYDVVQVLTFDDVGPGENRVRIALNGKGRLMAQVTARYYLPWNALPQVAAEGGAPLDIQVQYDRTTLRVDDTVGVSVTVTLKEGTGVDWALIDLGTPPGFTVLTEELEGRIARDTDLVADYVGGRMKKFELTGRQILVYLQDLPAGMPLTFQYRLRARFPLTAQAPASQAYDYYNPSQRGEQPPTLLVVQP